MRRAGGLLLAELQALANVIDVDAKVVQKSLDHLLAGGRAVAVSGRRSAATTGRAHECLSSSGTEDRLLDGVRVCLFSGSLFRPGCLVPPGVSGVVVIASPTLTTRLVHAQWERRAGGLHPLH